VGFAASRFYVGYPAVASGSPPEISPLTVVPVEVDRSDGHVEIHPIDAALVNYRILEDAGYTVDEAVEFASRVEERVRAGSEESAPTALMEAIREIAEITGLADVDMINPAAVDATGPFELNGSLSNVALLFASDRLGYTQSTRQELKTLAASTESWMRTPVGTFLGDEPAAADASAARSNPASPPIIVVSPLSEAQRQSVGSALTNPLTVVTGPPGTGKSELVLNLVANGLARGETVLVASRNNKAVDVVADRFRGLTDEAALVRAGSGMYRDRAVALMRRVVAGVRPPSVSQIERVQSEQLAVQAERTELLGIAAERERLQAECDRLERAWERTAAEIAADERSRVQELRGSVTRADVQTCADARRHIEERAAGKRTFLERLLRPIWPLRALRESRVFLARMAMATPALYDQRSWDVLEWSELVDQARHAELRAAAAVAWVEFHDAVDALDATGSDEAVGERLAALAVREAEAGRRSLAVERERGLAELPEADNKKLAEYLRAVDQLNGPERLGGRLYSELRRLEERLFSDVLRVFPVWSLTTLTARRNLPLKAGLFDMLIVDEASQCDLPSALPLLARARRVVVIGDDKQLIHVTPLSQQTEQALAAEAGLSPEELVNYSYRQVSLFTLARHLVSDRHAMILLDEHYRSHPDIIGFSNTRFYGGRLSVFTEPSRIHAVGSEGGPAIEWVHVAGATVRPRTGSAYNEAEIEQTCDVVAGLLADRSDRLTIGVVTPFRLQKERLTHALADRLDGPTIEKHLVIADTAHGFQGDERDVVIMSTVISAGAQPSSVEFVERNPNLFNVAVTRARSKLIVVGDEDVCAAREGLLGELARYARALKAGPAGSGGTGATETDEEELLLVALHKLGVRAVAQFGVRGLRIDMAIPDNDPPLAIEVDGSSHATTDGSRYLRDVYRDVKLRRAGWNVYRVPAWRVRLDPAGEARAVAATLGRTTRGKGEGAVRAERGVRPSPALTTTPGARR
jgi:very-short-patch-repair endonuclease